MISPQRSAFRNWVEDQIRQSGPGFRFPPQRELSARWNLCRNTIASVLDEFARKGVLVRSPGKGTSVPQATPPATGTHDVKCAVETVVELVRNEIGQGTLPVNEPLPKIKYLCRRFRSSERTIVAACRALCREGLLCKSGKTYWISKPRVLRDTGVTKDACMFLNDIDSVRFAFTADPLALAYQKMERELRRYGYRVRFEATARAGELIAGWEQRGTWPDAVVFYRVDPGPRMDASWRVIGRLLELTGNSAPAILSDWTGTGVYKQIPRLTQVLSRGNLNTSMSRAIARFVVERGYLDALIMFDEHDDESSPLWHFWSFQKIAAELWKIAPGFRLRQIVRSRIDGESAESFLSRMCENRPDIPGYLASKYPSFPPTDSFVGSLVMTASPLDDALRLGEGGIWLFCRDFRAAQACEWLRTRKVAVPATVSILGFENDPSFFHLGISSCFHDWERVGYLMAHSLIGDIPLQKTSQGYIRVDSEIIERLTTLRSGAGREESGARIQESESRKQNAR